MPNWSTNHTVFIGSAATLDTIEAAVSDAQFDFDLLHPRPEIYDTYTSPVRTVTDEAFTERYGFDAPHTIDEFIETHKLHNTNPQLHAHEKQFNLIPETVYASILETYGQPDWFDWSYANWGTKWTGSSASVQHRLPNLLVVDYMTAWGAPSQLFEYLLATYPDLQIINGSELEGFSDEIEVTHGCEMAFRAYYSVNVSTTVEPYDFTSGDERHRGMDIYLDTQCPINTENLEVMEESGYLINADGEGMDVNTLK